MGQANLDARRPMRGRAYTPGDSHTSMRARSLDSALAARCMKRPAALLQARLQLIRCATSPHMPCAKAGCLRRRASGTMLHTTSPSSDCTRPSLLCALTRACAKLHRGSCARAASAASCLDSNPLSVCDGQVAEVIHTRSWRSTRLAKRSGVKSADSRQPVVDCSEYT